MTVSVFTWAPGVCTTYDSNNGRNAQIDIHKLTKTMTIVIIKSAVK